MITPTKIENFNDDDYEFIRKSPITVKENEINTLAQETLTSQIPTSEDAVDLTNRLITVESSSKDSNKTTVIENKTTASEQDLDFSCEKFFYDTMATIYNYTNNNNHSKKNY